MGSKKPAFPPGVKTFSYDTAINTTLALTCQAQAYPVPFFR